LEVLTLIENGGEEYHEDYQRDRGKQNRNRGMEHHHRQAVLEVMAMRTLPRLHGNFHAAHPAGLGGKVSAHTRGDSNDEGSPTPDQ
jgi:hypothetical protein